ncbi:cbb3-type cytochrome c oxidase subunit II [Arcticibacter eurypsychrophilus]|uniref:cbb3-type cytochrome c oxidase subunit II n=1 Tax=Arcticibacter eurypsychrophilus TaxID=1434752 RepID=UPI00084DA7D3|nr:cbb3-type cytochrome c oxidase subunit II [Arcticibacter eurypsychrophilus]
MDFINDHKKLFLTAFALFAFLTIMVAIIPAIQNQNNNSTLPGAESLSEDALAGKAVYLSNGCVACHTQQVRNVAMDEVWGSRPSLAADYAGNKRTDFWRNTATLMGTERTGPDLTNIGNRQPSVDWHLLHLYQPRSVVAQSIMPAYPWLFETKSKLEKGDVEIKVPEGFSDSDGNKIVATKEALQLVAYLKALKQAKLYDENLAPDFLYRKEPELSDASSGEKKDKALNGKALYSMQCQTCHQLNGEGLKGAFPPLKGSPVVLDDNPEKLIDIIMNGYDAREEYGVMPAVGKNGNLKPEEISAIINHERSSWGNNARKVSPEEVKKIIESLK